MGYIGVDLDGTLAHYDGWRDGEIGAPVARMVERVRAWLVEGREVRIVTARVGPGQDPRTLGRETRRIQAWCQEHLGRVLPVQCFKDYAMVELWDDRAVQVVPNTGERADRAEDYSVLDRRGARQ